MEPEGGTKSANASLGGENAGARPRPWLRLRENQEKLTHQTEIRPEFEYELLLIFAKNELAASLVLPAFAVVIALAMVTWAPVNLVILWLTGVLLAKMILVILSRQFATSPRREVRVRPWRTRLMGAEFFYGASWGALAFLGIQSPDPTVHMFVMAALTVIISMRMMFASAAMPIVYAGTLPMTSALVIRFLLLNTPFYWAMAAMTLGVHLFFIFLMRGLNSTVHTMLEYKAEKDALIADLEQANSVLEEAKRRAEESNLAKSRFLATMSHELRTPLNAILGFSEVMEKELLGPHAVPTYKEYARDIHESGRHLLNLINEILDLTRIEAGRYELHEEPVSLSEVMAECFRLVKLRADSKGLRITESYAPNLPRVWADERAVRQICLNLLSNAVKFTPNGGEIFLSVGRDEGGGQFLSVRDTGPGIPDEEIPQVLRSFGQGSLAHEIAEGGTGLGLPIVRGLIELHGGQFHLRTKLREGTEVRVVFPPERVMEVLPPTAAKGRLRPPHPQTLSAHPETVVP